MTDIQRIAYMAAHVVDACRLSARFAAGHKVYTYGSDHKEEVDVDGTVATISQHLRDVAYGKSEVETARILLLMPEEPDAPPPT